MAVTDGSLTAGGVKYTKMAVKTTIEQYGGEFVDEVTDDITHLVCSKEEFRAETKSKLTSNTRITALTNISGHTDQRASGTATGCLYCCHVLDQ